MTKRRFVLAVLLCVISFTAFLSSLPFVFGDVVDYTSFTEVDPNSHIGLVGTNHVDFEAWMNEDAYLYSDFGADAFDDFTHYVDVSFDNPDSQTWNMAGFWGISNNVDGIKGHYNNGYSGVWVTARTEGSTTLMIMIIETYGGGYYYDLSTYLSDETFYFCKIVKSGTSCDVYIYSNSDYTGLVDSVGLTLHGDYSMRYGFAAVTEDGTTNERLVLDIENSDFGFASNNAPVYSNAGNDGVTRVGASVAVSCYWEDLDGTLSTCYLETNTTGTPQNSSISVSGASAWANASFTLNYTIGMVVQYRWFCSDDLDTWNYTQYFNITTTALSLVYRLNNSTWGAFYVDGVEITVNGTVKYYNYNESVLLSAYPVNASYAFRSFNWTASSTTNNPATTYATTHLDTLWCFFEESEGEAGFDYLPFLIVALVLLLFVTVLLLTDVL